MKNVNIEKVKTIWNTWEITDETAVLKIAREFEKESVENLDDIERKFIAYRHGEELNPVTLLNELGRKYSF